MQKSMMVDHMSNTYVCLWSAQRSCRSVTSLADAAGAPLCVAPQAVPGGVSPWARAAAPPAAALRQAGAALTNECARAAGGLTLVHGSYAAATHVGARGALPDVDLRASPDDGPIQSTNALQARLLVPVGKRSFLQSVQCHA